MVREGVIMATFDVLSNKNFDKSSKSPKSAFADNLHLKSKTHFRNHKITRVGLHYKWNLASWWILN